jgi:hypothetical protein
MHRQSMYHRLMRDEIERFVASLSIPADRKAILLAELTDHAACASEAALREGRDPDAAARAALGDLEALRRSLETVEPSFRVTRRQTVARGLAAGVLVAILLDRGGAAVSGELGAVAALAIALALAPARWIELLRAELRAPHVRGSFGLTRGVPVGPALAYVYTVMCVPFVVWVALIVQRVGAGALTLVVPRSAFAVLTAGYVLLLVEGLRARLAAAG